MGPNGVGCREASLCMESMDRREYAMLYFNTRQSDYMPPLPTTTWCLYTSVCDRIKATPTVHYLGGFHVPPYSCSPVVLCLSVHPLVPPSVCLCARLRLCPLCMLFHSRLTTKSSMTAKVPILHRKLTFYHRCSQLRYWHTTSGILCPIA